MNRRIVNSAVKRDLVFYHVGLVGRMVSCMSLFGMVSLLFLCSRTLFIIWLICFLSVVFNEISY